MVGKINLQMFFAKVSNAIQHLQQPSTHQSQWELLVSIRKTGTLKPCRQKKLKDTECKTRVLNSECTVLFSYKVALRTTLTQHFPCNWSNCQHFWTSYYLSLRQSWSLSSKQHMMLQTRQPPPKMLPPSALTQRRSPPVTGSLRGESHHKSQIPALPGLGTILQSNVSIKAALLIISSWNPTWVTIDIVRKRRNQLNQLLADDGERPLLPHMWEKRACLSEDHRPGPESLQNCTDQLWSCCDFSEEEAQ